MRILRLSTTRVRGLRDGAWSFAPERGGPGHVTVVTGPTGVGLTTFLDAITFTAAKLAVGGIVPSAADVLRAGASTAMIRTSFWLDAEERSFGGLVEETANAEVVFQQGGLGRADADPALLGVMSRYDHSARTGKIVAIPARRFGEGASLALGDFEVDQRFSRLSTEPGKFAGIPHALAKHASGYGERARFAAVQALFRELCPTAQLVWVEATGELEFALASGPHVPLKRLSFSERNAFVLAALPALLSVQRSVILLDTPELGLAPGEAARWLGVLRNHTSEAQWIVASRDPAVVASVEPAARIDLGKGAS